MYVIRLSPQRGQQVMSTLNTIMNNGYNGDVALLTYM